MSFLRKLFSRSGVKDETDKKLSRKELVDWVREYNRVAYNYGMDRVPLNGNIVDGLYYTEGHQRLGEEYIYSRQKPALLRNKVTGISLLPEPYEARPPIKTPFDRVKDPHVPRTYVQQPIKIGDTEVPHIYEGRERVIRNVRGFDSDSDSESDESNEAESTGSSTGEDEIVADVLEVVDDEVEEHSAAGEGSKEEADVEDVEKEGKDDLSSLSEEESELPEEKVYKEGKVGVRAKSEYRKWAIMYESESEGEVKIKWKNIEIREGPEPEGMPSVSREHRFTTIAVEDMGRTETTTKKQKVVLWVQSNVSPILMRKIKQAVLAKTDWDDFEPFINPDSEAVPLNDETMYVWGGRVRVRSVHVGDKVYVIYHNSGKADDFKLSEQEPVEPAEDAEYIRQLQEQLEKAEKDFEYVPEKESVILKWRGTEVRESEAELDPYIDQVREKRERKKPIQLTGVDSFLTEKIPAISKRTVVRAKGGNSTVLNYGIKDNAIVKIPAPSVRKLLSANSSKLPYDPRVLYKWDGGDLRFRYFISKNTAYIVYDGQIPKPKK